MFIYFWEFVYCKSTGYLLNLSIALKIALSDLVQQGGSRPTTTHTATFAHHKGIRGHETDRQTDRQIV